MSDIAKNIFSTTDKFNFLSNTKNITKLLSKHERFATESNTEEDEQQRLQQLCNKIVGLRIFYIFIIFVVLLMASSGENSIVSVELFMGLSLLSLLMPDVVVIIMIIIFIINKVDNTSTVETNKVAVQPSLSSPGPEETKFTLTQTPDIFN